MLKQIDLVFGAVAQTATNRLQAIFKAMLLRRRKDSVGVFLRICPRALLTLYKMLDGKRLIELPGKEVILHKLQFTQEERDIYKMVSALSFTRLVHLSNKFQVEARSQATFNRFLRAGTVLK